jgi:hypothetical protein
VVNLKTLRSSLLLALFLLALGGMIIHYLVHTPLVDLDGDGSGEVIFTNLAAVLFSLLDVFLVTFLFSRKSTASWAYMLNGLIVIYGTVFMAHSGIAKVHAPGVPFYRYLLIPTSPDIFIAWADFFMGYLMFKLWFLEAPVKTEPARQP